MLAPYNKQLPIERNALKSFGEILVENNKNFDYFQIKLKKIKYKVKHLQPKLVNKCIIKPVIKNIANYEKYLFYKIRTKSNEK